MHDVVPGNTPSREEVPDISRYFGISDAAFRVWQVLWRNQSPAGTVNKTLVEIGKHLPRASGKPMGKASVHRYLKELEKVGLVDFSKGLLKLSFPKIPSTPKQAENDDRLSNEQRLPVVERTTLSGFFSDLGRLVVERTTAIVTSAGIIYIYINNINNKINTNINLSSIPQQEEDSKQEKKTRDTKKTNSKKQPEERPFSKITDELFPGAPCALEEVESYFRSRFEVYGLHDDPHDEAMKFMEHHGTMNGWWYQPKNKSAKYKKPITRASWIRHAVFWVTNVKTGNFRDKRPTPPTSHSPGPGLNGSSYPFTYQEVLRHASTHGLSVQGTKWMDRNYESNGKIGPGIRWRFIGDPNTLKRQYVRR
jgi:hypothetical protein